MTYQNKINTTKETLTKLEREYNRQNLNVEIKVAQGTRVFTSAAEQKIVEYSLSSLNRRLFMKHLILAFYDNNPLSYNQLVKLLGISGTGLKTMWRECYDAEWMLITNETEAKTETSQTAVASEELVKAYDDYCRWLRNTWKDIGLRSVSTAIFELDQMLANEEANKLPSYLEKNR
tara:strand:- start:775 stop:1302 length:528 start_codon:yes stop_codon:yes gene_type:complete